MASPREQVELSTIGAHHHHHHPVQEGAELLTPIGKRLVSGLLGVNLLVLGASCVVAQALNPEALSQQEPRLLVLVLVGVSLLWMLWFLLLARRRPPHRDHHAAGPSVLCVLLLFSGCSLLLCVCRAVYLMEMKECKAAASLLAPFIEAPFLLLQTYLLWTHSKDCLHTPSTTTRCGLIVMASTDLLLWLRAVMEDSVHLEVELEKAAAHSDALASTSETGGASSVCHCGASASCLVFRKLYELLFPFHMEFYLMATCLVYVMWKNVGRRTNPDHHPAEDHQLSLALLRKGRVVLGLVCGFLVLLVGVVVFILYQVWMGEPEGRHAAFVSFYGFHLCVMPLMCVCSVAGIVVHRLERRKHDGGHNPTRSLDVALLLATAVGQLALAYLSLLAAMFVRSIRSLRNLEVSYSALSLLEIILQNIFIINGLHRHPSALARKKGKQWSDIFKTKKKKRKKNADLDEQKTDASPLEVNSLAPPAVLEDDVLKTWSRRITQEICVFLILANITMWFIPAFGLHPQFENGLGKQFYGFGSWFVLVNLFQPLSVFYRMHSVGALVELLVSA